MFKEGMEVLINNGTYIGCKGTIIGIMSGPNPIQQKYYSVHIPYVKKDNNFTKRGQSIVALFNEKDIEKFQTEFEF